MNIEEQYDAVLCLLTQKPLRTTDIIRETGWSRERVRTDCAHEATGEVIVSKKGRSGDMVMEKGVTLILAVSGVG